MKRLVADVMLSKLARWLRLSGNPVTDAPSPDDDKIIRYAKRTGATLLTLDRALSERSNRRSFDALLIQGVTTEEQLAFVARELGLKIGDRPALVCPICGSGLKPVAKSYVAELVPEEAASRHRLFYYCRSCKKAYWKGTHWKEISRRLAKAKRLSEKTEKKEIRRSGSPRLSRLR